MPRRHRTKRFEIKASVPSSASSDTVMRRILRPRTWPAWQSEIVSVDGPEHLEKGSIVDGAARLLGFDVTGRSITTDVGEDLFEEDVIVGVRMRVTYRVGQRDEGSTITHQMSADLPSGLAGSVLSLFLALRLRKMQHALLERLRVQAEEEPA